MERVVKGFTGYGKEKEGKPATHVILTVEEYDKLLRDIREAENTTQETISEAKKKITQYKKSADDTIIQERQEAEKRIEAIQSDLNKAEVEIHRLNDLNANMLRIGKERANAKRGLKPKKTHHGYMLLDSQQQNYVFRYWINGRPNLDEFPCWKVRIQSPYDSSIPYETISKNIYDDLKGVFGSALGINSICDIKKMNYSEFNQNWSSNENFIFKTSYKANIKSSLWEIEYLVKCNIIVPEDMKVAR